MGTRIGKGRDMTIGWNECRGKTGDKERDKKKSKVSESSHPVKKLHLERRLKETGQIRIGKRRRRKTGTTSGIRADAETNEFEKRPGALWEGFGR
jgi:hypothetical protein